MFGKELEADEVFAKLDPAELDQMPVSRVCEWHRSRGAFQKALDVADAALAREKPHRLGIAFFRLWRVVPREQLGETNLDNEFDEAVNQIIAGGLFEDVPMGLTRRAEYLIKDRRYDRALKDLDEAIKIAARCTAYLSKRTRCSCVRGST